MGFVISVVLFWLGLFAGVIYFSTALLPLIYGLPKSLYLALRGEMRWMAPLRYLLVGVSWLLGWAVIFFAIFQIFPGSEKYLFESGAFNFGSTLGTVGGFFRVAMSNASNADLQDDFANFTEKYVIFVSEDAQKYASLKACSDTMRNLFILSIGGVIVTLIANKFENGIVYVAYLIFSYLILAICSLDFLTKILATGSSLILFAGKAYHWLVGDIGKAKKLVRFADVVATFVALALSGATILVSYISMSIVTPSHWNIFTFIGL